MADDRQRGYVLDGWNITGDAFWQDDEGYFHFAARNDDMIVSAGYNIAGFEVEAALLKHAAVAECAVIGVADDLKGYDELDAVSARDLAAFARAIEAAEKASPRPINAQGAEAVRRGRAVWAHVAQQSKARVAQEWMSWTLPSRCEATASLLETQARMAGVAFDTSAAPAEPAAAEAPAPEAVPES